MAYFNAQAAVAAAFLPHNIAAAAGMNANPGAASPAAVLGLAGHQAGGNIAAAAGMNANPGAASPAAVLGLAGHQAGGAPGFSQLKTFGSSGPGSWFA
ncbi:hypothetical protein QE152_g22875 [Popillia japonica]|uniref:Uncharacterized protein n=1 Tax=Popillia japonica TaxID=7064 RepID=A0AAW1KJB9_POPJA